MKTITGKVLSTNPIALSKAASILSTFASVDTGASHAVCAYLRRASASFNELAQLHKELKSNRKHKTSKSEIIIEEEKPAPSVLLNQIVIVEEKTKKKKRKSGEIEEGRGMHSPIKEKKKKNCLKERVKRNSTLRLMGTSENVMSLPSAPMYSLKSFEFPGAA